MAPTTEPQTKKCTIALENIVHHTTIPKNLRISLREHSFSDGKEPLYSMVAELEDEKGLILPVTLINPRTPHIRQNAELYFAQTIQHMERGEYRLHTFSDHRIELEVPFKPDPYWLPNKRNGSKR